MSKDEIKQDVKEYYKRIFDFVYESTDWGRWWASRQISNRNHQYGLDQDQFNQLFIEDYVTRFDKNLPADSDILRTL